MMLSVKAGQARPQRLSPLCIVVVCQEVRVQPQCASLTERASCNPHRKRPPMPIKDSSRRRAFPAARHILRRSLDERRSDRSARVACEGSDRLRRETS
jgi:hypothetical protein